VIRWTTAVILLGMLVAAVLFDRIEKDPNVTASADILRSPTPALAATAPLSSSWFCPVGSAGAESYADAEVTISNVGTEPSVANLDIRTSDGPGPGLRLDVPAGTSETVALSTLGSFDAAAVAVEMIGGEGVVSHRVTTSAGSAEGPCASAPSATWYFGGGPTTTDATQYIALLNPFPNDAVFSATFQTPTRVRQPNELEARTVPANSVVVIEVGDFVAPEDVVAATIQTVGAGQIVVERLFVLDGSIAPVGATLEAAVAEPQLRWSAPTGRVHSGGDHTLTVFNPTDRVAEIDVRLDPLAAQDRLVFGLVPIELTVQPGRLATIDLRTTADQLVLPLPYDVGLTVVSANGVPVVLHRWQTQPGAGAAAEEQSNVSERRRQNDGDVPAEELPPEVEGPAYLQPTARQGVAGSHGSPITSTRWIAASTTLLPDNGTAVIVFGEQGALVEVRLLVGGSLGSPVRAAVEATGRAVIPLSPVAERAAVVVTSDAPVVAELSIVGPDRHDVVPLVPTLAAADLTAEADDPRATATNPTDLEAES
jgi:hypothetical protein